MEKEDLGRAKRACLRSIKKHRDTVKGYLSQNPSDTLVQTLQTYLDLLFAELSNLKSIDSQLLRLIDYTGLTTEAAVEKAESEITSDYDTFLHEYGLDLSKLKVISLKLENDKRKKTVYDRESLNATFTQQQSPLSKLPDIKVPTFDGNIHAYTNWQALFEAIVDSNESLTDIHKLYYLKNALVGDAKPLLADYTLTEGTYALALAHVKQRYFNKRAIIKDRVFELLQYPNIEVATLRRSIDHLQATERGLKICGLDTAKMSPLLALIVVSKLPDELHKDWENSITDNSTYPSFETLMQFLSNSCFSCEVLSTRDKANKPTPASRSKDAEKKDKSLRSEKTVLTTVKPQQRAPYAQTSYSQTSYVPKCIDCKGDHTLFRCPNFEKMSVDERSEFVTSRKLCKNCLRPNHAAEVCNASTCRLCGGKHSTKLHREPATNSTQPSAAADTSSKATLLTSSALRKPREFVLLPCAIVRVHVAAGKYVRARAFIDGCSQSNLVTEAFVRRNKLVTSPVVSNIDSIGPTTLSNHVVELTVASQYNDYTITLLAEVIGRLPYQVSPTMVRSVAQLDSTLQLADNEANFAQVDILIGAAHSNRILSGNKKFIGETCFEASELGWIVSGPLPHAAKVNRENCYLTTDVKDILSQFWEVDQVDPPRKSLSEYELIEAHFEATHTRRSDGRFKVRLPFKSLTPKLANTYAQARSALLRSEPESDSSMRALYVEFMREYRELGHMKLVDKTAEIIDRYYIAHLPVFRPDSSTTKLRVVFNASARNNTGVSLNECLLNGDEIQPPLFNTLLNHRKYPVAFSGDIGKMYRQIAMNKLDWRWQTILWRDHPTDPVLEWELTTLTYGEKPASYIAKKCLRKVAEEVQATEPEVAEAISTEFAMDDMLSGASTVDAAIAKQRKIHDTLLRAKFPLRKYVSNSPELLKALEPSLVEQLRAVEFSSAGVAKILGLQWNPTDDVYQVISKIIDIKNVSVTKRSVSSLIASVYDPLGLVAPVLIKGKILLQDLWREELDWDETVSTELAEQFKTYYQSLANLAEIKIPRAYPTGEFEIIGFCDASVKAYGAVVYARSNTSIVLICSKTKVAPIKALTIPRLELLGATLLTMLTKRVASILKKDPSSSKLFCDSTVALAWIKGPASKYETFVRNRVDYVTSIAPTENWTYVKSADNPADLLTHGLTPTELAKSSLWLCGPAWLQSFNWPSEDVELPIDPPEQRQSKQPKVTLVTSTVSEELISSYSSYDKLIRITTLVSTFVNRLRKKPDCTTRQATDIIYRSSQGVWFAQEIEDLRTQRSVAAKSHLLSLEPFLDSSGVLRAGGRLSNADLPYETKHPTILHCKSKLAKLLTKHAHEAYAHASHSFVLAYLRRKFYLVHGGMKLVRSTIRRCVYCTQMNAKAAQQIMGDLPADRTRIARPFTSCGIDFAGPFTVRCTNHRSPKHLKHYAAFFVCLSTRAVHIESVADLSTEAFMYALRRFVARRGVPATIWSDNATNFVGARNSISKTPATLNIDWKFIPPRSPHHGGIWEAAVKAGKKRLLSVSKGSVLTEDEFKTTLTTVEAILNSRPLYRRKVESEYDTIDVITPGHFLVQSDLLSPDSPETIATTLFERHNAQRQLINQFWATWRRSYLTQLQRKSKWVSTYPNLKPDDVVLIREQSSPLSWPLARVIDVLPDRKGRVRIVRLRTKGSDFVRSIQQVVRLPVEEEPSTA